MKHPKYYDTDEATSRRMSNVKLKHGDAENILAKMLWHKGYRYRLNYKKLPGSPDIAITNNEAILKNIHSLTAYYNAKTYQVKAPNDFIIRLPILEEEVYKKYI